MRDVWEVIEWYADPTNWSKQDAYYDQGTRARSILHKHFRRYSLPEYEGYTGPVDEDLT